MAPSLAVEFSATTPLSADQRETLRRRFFQIIDHYERSRPQRDKRSYNPVLLISSTYDFAMSEQSKDIFLRAFFKAMSLSIDLQSDTNLDAFRTSFFGFADYLIDNFFLPLKASGTKTPQPTPAYHSAAQEAQGGPQNFAGSSGRVAALRGECLTRDGHRCAISRKFDLAEADTRLTADGEKARDDDGVLLSEDPSPSPYACLEVAHILPHSLTNAPGGQPLDPGKQAALSILNMFDSGVSYLVEGSNIDRPRNAITLTADLHTMFGGFKIFFEPCPEPSTYRIDTLRPSLRTILRDPVLPITRTLCRPDNRAIDLPSPRLLAIHRAVCHILHLSAAGEYIESLLRDAEEKGVRADGSTELGRLLKLGLRGWEQELSVS